VKKDKKLFPVLFRVTKMRYELPWDHHTKQPTGPWRITKHEISYVTREGDVKNALNYARRYSTDWCKYTVKVEVALEPYFLDYDTVKAYGDDLAVGILKSAGENHGKPGNMGSCRTTHPGDS
jgi:hypothetical protein